MKRENAKSNPTTVKRNQAWNSKNRDSCMDSTEICEIAGDKLTSKNAKKALKPECVDHSDPDNQSAVDNMKKFHNSMEIKKWNSALSVKKHGH